MNKEHVGWRTLVGYVKCSAVGLLLCGPVAVMACVESQTQERSIWIRHWSPIDMSGKLSTPRLQNMPIGWVYAYSVPRDATVVVKPLRQGSVAPLEVLGEDTVTRIRPLLRNAPSAAPVENLSVGQKWIYVHAASYGKAELHLSSPSGWRHAVVLGMVYPQPAPTGDPTPLELSEPDQEPQFVLDANRNTLWLSVAGRLDDGWNMVGGQETSLQLMRLEQLEVPYGDEPRVGIFLVGSRSMSPGSIAIQRGAGASEPPQVFRFHIQVRPVAACG